MEGGQSTAFPLTVWTRGKVKGFLHRDVLTSVWFWEEEKTEKKKKKQKQIVIVCTSMRAQEVIIGNWPRLGKGLELVKPLAGDVELQKAGLHHAE